MYSISLLSLFCIYLNLLLVKAVLFTTITFSNATSAVYPETFKPENEIQAVIRLLTL